MKKSKVTAAIAVIATTVSTLALSSGPASAWAERSRTLSSTRPDTIRVHKPFGITGSAGTAIARASVASL